MMRRLLFPLVLGAGGVAILLWLGTWQLQRLDWKEGLLTDLEARMAAEPMDLPADPEEEADEYRAVTLTGQPVGEELHVLVSGTAAGTGYLAVTAFETDTGRRILLDQGLLALDAKDLPPARRATEVTGRLIWPDDVTSSTPVPDLDRNIWFGRDVAAMAEALGTEPVLVTASTMSPPDPRLTPLPIDSANVKNDHLEYAITWFLLAAVWAVMSGVLVIRTLRQKDA